jgi:hypothetical protein
MLLCVVGALFAPSVQAHEVRPGYLELQQSAADTYNLLFKLPALGEEFRLALYVSLPEGTRDIVGSGTRPRANGPNPKTRHMRQALADVGGASTSSGRRTPPECSHRFYGS